MLNLNFKKVGTGENKRLGKLKGVCQTHNCVKDTTTWTPENLQMIAFSFYLHLLHSVPTRLESGL